MKHEYHEGPKAGENFKRLATEVLQKPKKAGAELVELRLAERESAR